MNHTGFKKIMIPVVAGMLISATASHAQTVFDGSPATFSVSNLNGINGVSLNTADSAFSGDRMGRDNTSGDLNGDGIDDLIISSAYYNATAANSREGRIFVIFGGSQLEGSASASAGSLAASDGFTISGSAPYDIRTAFVSSGGDLSGDGIDDLVIADRINDECFIIFGSTTIGGSDIQLTTLNGNDGFRITSSFGDNFGIDAEIIPSINGDSISDLIIGANEADEGGTERGAAYVVFGSTGLTGTASYNISALTNGTLGFTIPGEYDSTRAGTSVAGIGDVNGDGFHDFSAGVAQLSGSTPGGSYVVFGGPGIGSSGTLDPSDLDGSNGFVFVGPGNYSQAGDDVAGAGDLNGDSFSDIIVTARGNQFGGIPAGSTYVIFGGPNVGSTGSVDHTSLNGTNGFRFDGEDFLYAGYYASGMGDLNGDGFDDMAVIGRGRIGNVEASTTILFGSSTIGSTASIAISDIDGANGIVINGFNNKMFNLFHPVDLIGDVNDDGAPDLIIGSPGNNSDDGEAFLIFGKVSNQVSIPTPTISSIDSPTSLTTITGVPVTFDEDVATLETTDFVTTGGLTVTSISGGPQNYTIDLSASGDGVKSLQLPAGAVEDTATTPNLSLASNVVSFELDTDGPEFTTRLFSTDNATNTDYGRNGNTVTITLESSEPVTTPTVELDSVPMVLTGGPVNWSSTRILDGTIPDGTVFLRVEDYRDIAGNNGQPYLSNVGSDGEDLVIDNVPPSVLSPLAAGSGQADPTNSLPVVFEVSFGNDTVAFDETSVDLSSSTAPGSLVANISISKSLENSKGGPPPVFEISVSGATDSGDITVNLVPANIFDPAGNTLPSAGAPAIIQYIDNSNVDEWMLLND